MQDLSFNTDMMPFSMRGHKVYLLQNSAYYTDEERLKFHFTTWCQYCDTENTIRGNLPREYSSIGRLRYIKLIVVGYYNFPCATANRKTYVP